MMHKQNCFAYRHKHITFFAVFLAIAVVILLKLPIGCDPEILNYGNVTSHFSSPFPLIW